MSRLADGTGALRSAEMWPGGPHNQPCPIRSTARATRSASLGSRTRARTKTSSGSRRRSAWGWSGSSPSRAGSSRKGASMKMSRDFVEMLSALSRSRAEYVIVGAYAVAAHGRPRATGDLDIWVRATPENAPKVLLALQRFGAPLFDLTLADLSAPGIVFQIGQPPCRIDLL